MKSTTHEVPQFLIQFGSEAQKKITPLLNEYKKHFADSYLKKQKWWNVDLVDGQSLNLTFDQAIDKIQPSFLNKSDKITWHQAMKVLSKDKDFKRQFETITKHGWKNFVAESAWNTGGLWLPYPISTTNSIVFSPVHQGEYIENPIDMAKLIETPIQPKIDPADIIKPISLAELKALNYHETKTNKEKTLKQLLTEPYRVQKKNGYYSYQHFLKLLSEVIEGMMLEDYTYDEILDEDSEWLEERFLKRFGSTPYLGTVEILCRCMAQKTFFPISYYDKNLFLALKETHPPDNISFKNVYQQHIVLYPKVDKTLNPALYIDERQIYDPNTPVNIFAPVASIFWSGGATDGYFTNCVTISQDGNDVWVDLSAEITVDEVANEFTIESDPNIINLLLFMQREQDAKEVIELDAPTRKMGLSKNTKQIIVPRVIGEGYKPKIIRNYESTGTHASPRTHWRSGHWRQQPYGKKDDPKLKTIWLEPVLVNG